MLVDIGLDTYSIVLCVEHVNVYLTFVCYLVKMVMLLLVSRIGLRRGATRAANKVWRGNEVLPCSFFHSLGKPKR